MKLTLASVPRRAFTMIEILVASSILVLIIFSIYSTWTMIMKSARLTQEAAVEVQRGRIAIRAVEDALLTAQNFDMNRAHYTFETATEDENFHAMVLTCRLPPTFPGSGLFGDYVLRQVKFVVAEGEEGKHQLIMSQLPILWMTNETVQEYSITLVRDLSLFILEFWDVKRGEWMADFTTTNSLPRMMRVTVGWGHHPKLPNEPAEIVTRVVSLPSTIVLGDVQYPRQ